MSFVFRIYYLCWLTDSFFFYLVTHLSPMALLLSLLILENEDAIDVLFAFVEYFISIMLAQECFSTIFAF